MPINVSALIEYNKELNSQAYVREYLMRFTTNLSITTSTSIQLQASSLVQLTSATNQLTRTTLVRFKFWFFENFIFNKNRRLHRMNVIN
jgi:hypothetical protein